MWLALDRMRVPGCGVPPPNNNNNKFTKNKSNQRNNQEIRRRHRVISDHHLKRRETHHHRHHHHQILLSHCGEHSVNCQPISGLSPDFLTRTEGLSVLPVSWRREKSSDFEKIRLQESYCKVNRWIILEPCGSV